MCAWIIHTDDTPQASHTRTHAEAATGANGAANASPYVSSDTRSCYKLQSSKVGGMVSL